MSKSLAVLQSNYIPWKGYFDILNHVDEFILYDDVQYTKNDWRNRNRIKTSNGLLWLTIPVRYTYPQVIRDTVISDATWAGKHWKTLAQFYARAPYFETYREALESLYTRPQPEKLSEVNYGFITAICDWLGITTRLSWVWEYEPEGDRVGRLLDLCRKTGATEYVSGPSAQSYIDPAVFEEAGIRLSYMEYEDYAEYDQLFPPFEHGVTILDLLLNTGPDATRYMLSFDKQTVAPGPER